MTFKKDFRMPVFEACLTVEWKKTSEVAKLVGCSQKTATKELMLLLAVKELQAALSETSIDMEMKWVPGGRKGTRSWRKVPNEDVAENDKKLKRIITLFTECKEGCIYARYYGLCG